MLSPRDERRRPTTQPDNHVNLRRQRVNQLSVYNYTLVCRQISRYDQTTTLLRGGHCHGAWLPPPALVALDAYWPIVGDGRLTAAAVCELVFT